MAGFSFPDRGLAMRYAKPPLSIPEQVDLLVRRGLWIDDIGETCRALDRISYYRLSAYWHPFKQPAGHFEAGASFQAALDLYEFDRALRLVVMNAVERVEIAVRTAVTYRLAHAYGPFGHVDPGNFRRGFQHAQWLAGLESEARRSHETFIEHYRAKYEDFPRLPIWMATEVLSLGSLSVLFRGMLSVDQRPITRSYDVHPFVLVSWLHTLTYVRNLCPHHSRLWNRRLAIKPQLPRHDPRWLPPATPRNDRVFAVFLILRQLMARHHEDNDWRESVETLAGPVVAEPRWRSAMGFPEDWTDQPLWNRPNEGG